MKTIIEKDLIIVERKVFLDLIATANKAKEYFNNNASKYDKLALNIRSALYNALPPAIESEYKYGEFLIFSRFPLETIIRTREALKNDAAGNVKCTMTDLDLACDIIDEMIKIYGRVA